MSRPTSGPVLLPSLTQSGPLPALAACPAVEFCQARPAPKETLVNGQFMPKPRCGRDPWPAHNKDDAEPKGIIAVEGCWGLPSGNAQVACTKCFVVSASPVAAKA